MARVLADALRHTPASAVDFKQLASRRSCSVIDEVQRVRLIGDSTPTECDRPMGGQIKIHRSQSGFVL
ncbi:MAG: hypothetical protein ACOYBJ_02355 [Patescibacteria group bacterium]